MDAIDRAVFTHIGEMLESYEGILKDSHTLLENALPATFEDVTAFDRLKAAIYMHSPDLLFIARHYFQALKAREIAIQEGDLTWYCAATYALCHDWGKVLDSVDWFGWRGMAAQGNRAYQAITVLVAALTPFPYGKLKECVDVLVADKADLAIRNAVKLGLIEECGGLYASSGIRYVLGPKAPVPCSE